jgi:hypothetical protein
MQFVREDWILLAIYQQRTESGAACTLALPLACFPNDNIRRDLGSVPVALQLLGSLGDSGHIALVARGVHARGLILRIHISH